MNQTHIHASESPRWYALYTKSYFEKKASSVLTQKNIENYCPLKKQERQWSDRKKVIWEPVIRSYLFVHARHTDFEDIRMTDGIVNFVYHSGRPAIIRDQEMETMKRFFHDYDEYDFTVTPLNPGDRVRIRSGVFMNSEGLVISARGRKARLILYSLNMQIQVVIPAGELVKI
jgi:transcription antitermination factor NusG